MTPLLTLNPPTFAVRRLSGTAKFSITSAEHHVRGAKDWRSTWKASPHYYRYLGTLLFPQLRIRSPPAGRTPTPPSSHTCLTNTPQLTAEISLLNCFCLPESTISTGRVAAVACCSGSQVCLTYTTLARARELIGLCSRSCRRTCLSKAEKPLTSSEYIGPTRPSCRRRRRPCNDSPRWLHTSFQLRALLQWPTTARPTQWRAMASSEPTTFTSSVRRSSYPEQLQSNPTLLPPYTRPPTVKCCEGHIKKLPTEPGDWHTI